MSIFNFDLIGISPIFSPQNTRHVLVHELLTLLVLFSLIFSCLEAFVLIPDYFLVCHLQCPS